MLGQTYDSEFSLYQNRLLWVMRPMVFCFLYILTIPVYAITFHMNYNLPEGTDKTPLIFGITMMVVHFFYGGIMGTFMFDLTD